MAAKELKTLIPAILTVSVMLGACSSGSRGSPDAVGDDAGSLDADDTTEPEPLVCDPDYNEGLGKGRLSADLNGVEGYENGYSSTDVTFTFTDMGRDRPMLSIHAREWCKAGVQRSDLLLSCLIDPSDLESLPLEIKFTSTFISGKNSCKASFTDTRAIFKKNPNGSISFSDYSEAGPLKGSFQVSLEESTDPESVADFKNGSFEAVAE